MRTSPNNFSPRHRGFTIIELMIVIGIIVLLMAILLPSLGKMYDSAHKAKAMSQLTAIHEGLNAYYQQFNIYPPSSGTLGTANRGSTLLAEALLGYQDYSVDGAGPSNGDPQYGFRVRKTNAAMGAAGEIYGPYVTTDPKTFNGSAFIDTWGKEIVYYRSSQAGVAGGSASITSIFGAGAPASYFNTADNSSVTGGGSPTDAKFLTMVGGNGNNNVTGTVMGAGSYLLISAGPDETFFTSDDVVLSK
jgi:prepilin-type N-terminal cleavage/methylation domain-containing protein